MAGFDIQGMISKLIGSVMDNPSILGNFKENPLGALSQVFGGALDNDTMGSLLSGLVNQAGNAPYADGISADGLFSALQSGGGGAQLSGLLGGLADENKNGIPDVLEGGGSGGGLGGLLGDKDKDGVPDALEGVVGGSGGGLGGGLLGDKDKDGVPDALEGVLGGDGDSAGGGLGDLLGGLLGGKGK